MELKFVDVGEGITEGHIQKWLVKDGDIIREDQPVVKIETDKAVVDVPAPASGVIKINMQENTDVHLGDILAYIGTLEEFKNKFTRPTPNIITVKTENKDKIKDIRQSMQQTPQKIQSGLNPTIQTNQTSTQNQNMAKEIIATPSVRKLAREMNIDISKVNGSGPNGRVLEIDLKNYLNVKQNSVVSKAYTTNISNVDQNKESLVEHIPMSQIRKVIAKNMEESWKIPRAVHMDKINATSLWNILVREKTRLEKERGIKLTILSFIIKATIEALKENPNFNASYDSEKMEIIRKKYYNIGLATESPDGLKVVVIKDADKKSIINIAVEINELHNKVLNNTISIDEMRDSTFTITNIGSLGGGYFSVPMINPPNIAILGIHLVRDEPVVIDGGIKIGKVLPFSLSFDHRVVDGAEAVLFGNTLIRYLEDPDFLEML
jgi:pyruvate dehydrogenase E2 component (dihydrolipoamide acetyltransferase)